MRTTRIPLFGLLATCLLLLSACDNALDTVSTELTEAEIALASEIAAQTLSDADDGTMADLNDLNASVSASGLGYGDGPVARYSTQQSRDWRQPNKRHRAAYDSTTGEHTIQYERSFTSPFYSKGLAVKLVYVFTDASGTFIARPKAEAASINAISFTGERSGHSKGERRNGDSRESRFTREATWKATDVQSGVVTFEGTQQDAGVFKVVRGDTTVERTYKALLRSQNVTITRGDADAGLEAAVTGQLVYAITLNRTVNGSTEEKVVEGTIELEGNGRALLRFLGTKQIYRIDLRDGAVSRG